MPSCKLDIMDHDQGQQIRNRHFDPMVFQWESYAVMLEGRLPRNLMGGAWVGRLFGWIKKRYFELSG